MADEGQQQETGAEEAPKAEAGETSAEQTASSSADQSNEKIFTILEGALKNADIDFENNRDPDAREHGRESVDMMETAFVHAARLDQARASEMYTKTTRKEVPPELLARAAREAGNAPSDKDLNDLADGIARLGKHRQHHGNKAMVSELDEKIDKGNVALGDREARALDHRRRANEQMMSGLDGKHRDDGLHLFQALQSGMRAGHEYHNMGRQRQQAKKMAIEHEDLHENKRLIVGEIRKFTAEQGDGPGGPTTGPNGQTVARNPSVFQRTAAVMARRAPAYEANPAKPGPSMAAKVMAAARTMGGGVGPGIGG